MHKQEIKALILVGGTGSRLRPITYNIPKPLVPFVNIPILERQIKGLSEAGIKEIILAMNYKYQLIEENVKSFAKKYNTKIIFKLEKEALGTAGPIAFAKKELQESVFLVLNSDIICDFPFNELINYHLSNNSLGTIMVTKVKDPSKFGVIKLENNSSLIKEFIEKPEMFVSDLVNAGIYIFSPEILKYFEEKPSMIEKEIFPLVAKNKELNTFNLKGYWADIGTPSGYLEGQRLFLNKQTNVVIGNNVKIGSNVLLENCVIFDDCVLEDNVIIKNCIIGNGCYIGEGCFLNNFSVLGFGSKIYSKK